MTVTLFTNMLYRSQKTDCQTERFKEEFLKRHVPLEILKNDEINVIGSHSKVDKCLFLDKDVRFARILEQGGARVFNSSNSIKIADDKAETLIALKDLTCAEYPETVVAPIIYSGVLTKEYIIKVGNRLGYPCVVKKMRGSLGIGVYIARSEAELIEVVENLGCEEILFQHFVKESIGRSIRVYVVGGRAIAAERLVNKKDFRSNAAHGGIAEHIDLSKKHLSAAEEITERIGLDFAGVDFFDCATPILIEINSNAYFTEVERVSGINVAGAIADLIINY